MLGGFMLLRMSSFSLIVASGYFTSILFAPAIMPNDLPNTPLPLSSQ